MSRVRFSPASPSNWSNYPAISPVTLVGDGLVYIELRPDLDYETIRGNAGIPTLVTRGLFRGFSLPVWNEDDQELYGTICVPSRWDGASDIFIHLYCWLAAANDAKNFNMQVGWEHYTPGTDIVPDTETLVPVQTATGAGAAQYQSYLVPFTLTYGDLVTDDILALRIRRIAASIDECAGDIVVNHYGILFRRDKLGAPAP